MRPIYRLALFFLLAVMFRSPLFRLYHTTRRFISVIPEAIRNPQSNPLTTANNMSRPSGLIANKGLELLTFGTPNGMSGPGSMIGVSVANCL